MKRLAAQGLPAVFHFGLVEIDVLRKFFHTVRHVKKRSKIGARLPHAGSPEIQELPS